MTSTPLAHNEAGAAARISAVVGSWQDVEIAPHRFGALAFSLGRRKLGHLHGDRIADIPFPRRIRDELVATGHARRHHAMPDCGWITFPIDREEDVDHA